MRKKTRIAILLTAGVASLCAAVFFTTARTPKIKNVIIISLDTLRADRLGAYGYHRTTSPNLDKLAKESTVFERAITTAPWTLPAHVSMLTGLYPHRHGVQRSRGQKLSDSDRYLAEILKEKGYRTIAVVGGGFISKVFGMNRGFDVFLGPSAYRGSEGNTFQPALNRLRKELDSLAPGQPYFAFVHTYDIHCPYNPVRHRGQFISEGAERYEVKCASPRSKRVVKPSNALYLSDRYDESIRDVDDSVDNLMEYLRSRPDYDETMIVITSDHGEEFLEHGRIGHRESLHRELLFVPMIVHVPGAKPQVITESASLIDIVPTALDLVNVETKSNLDGVSLADVVLGKRDPFEVRPFAFSELDGKKTRLFSRVGSKTHLILNALTLETKFYNLEEDPKEQVNLLESEGESVAEKQEDLLKFISSFDKEPTAESKSKTPMSKQEIEDLKSLGYL